MNPLTGDSGGSHDPQMEARVGVLEEIAAATKQGLTELRADTNRRFDAVDRRFEHLDRQIDQLRNAQERDFRLLFGALITTTLGLAVLMAKGFHWF